MDIATYLTEHDGKPRPDGPECIRLSTAVGASSYYLYLAALGHKKFSATKAVRLHESSIGGKLLPEGIRPDLRWMRDAEGNYAAMAADAA